MSFSKFHDSSQLQPISTGQTSLFSILSNLRLPAASLSLSLSLSHSLPLSPSHTHTHKHSPTLLLLLLSMTKSCIKIYIHVYGVDFHGRRACALKTALLATVRHVNSICLQKRSRGFLYKLEAISTA